MSRAGVVEGGFKPLVGRELQPAELRLQLEEREGGEGKNDGRGPEGGGEQDAGGREHDRGKKEDPALRRGQGCKNQYPDGAGPCSEEICPVDDPRLAAPGGKGRGDDETGAEEGYGQDKVV